jgi:hypothetical protein
LIARHRKDSPFWGAFAVFVLDSRFPVVEELFRHLVLPVEILRARFVWQASASSIQIHQTT